SFQLNLFPEGTEGGVVMRDTDEQVSHVADILAQRHPLFARATIERWVMNEFASYDSAPVQSYVPILAQREIDARLRDLEADGPAPTRPAPDRNDRARPLEPPRPRSPTTRL